MTEYSPFGYVSRCMNIVTGLKVTWVVNSIWHPLVVCYSKGPMHHSHFLLASCTHVRVGHRHGVSVYFAGDYNHILVKAT